MELGEIEFRPEPLNAIVERHLKAIWAARSYPHCDQETLHALAGSDRIWCSRCNWKTTYTRGTPFYDSELAPGEFLIAFLLYADTLLSSNQIAFLLSPCYKTIRETIREFEQPFVGDSRLSRIESPRQSVARHRWMKPSRCVQDSRENIRRGKASTASDRPIRKKGEPGGPHSTMMRWCSSRRVATCSE